MPSSGRYVRAWKTSSTNATRKPLAADIRDEAVDPRYLADAPGRLTTVRIRILAIGLAVSVECFSEYGPIVRCEPGWDTLLVATNTNGWSG